MVYRYSLKAAMTSTAAATFQRIVALMLISRTCESGEDIPSQTVG